MKKAYLCRTKPLPASRQSLTAMTQEKYIRSILFGLTFLVCLTGQAQTPGNTRSKQGNIEVVGDTRVAQMVEKHVAFNEMVSTTPGYRIQIASLSGSNSKQQAFVVKDQFKTCYPNVEVYIVFDEPNFKVKVGDFRSRLEAFAFLQEIKSAYPGHIIQDYINPEPPTYDLIPETEADAAE